jgi:hypothetical protein
MMAPVPQCGETASKILNWTSFPRVYNTGMEESATGESLVASCTGGASSSVQAAIF